MEASAGGVMLGKHLCLKCGHRWEAVHGPQDCPKCGHLYVKWLNYDEMRKKYKWGCETNKY